MLRFVLRRLLQMLGVVLALSLLVFFWLRSLPGGPVSALLGERATPERRARMEEALGLDEPLPVQYLRYMQRALRGDFGVSTKVLPGEDALDIFFARLPATIELAFFALAIAILLGIPLGYLAARRRGTALDNTAVIFSLVGVAVPVFFTGFLLKYFFAVEWDLLPVSGRQSTGLDATRVTGLFVLDGIMTREWDAAWDALKHLVLPAVALATIPFAVIFRITRASVLDVLDEDYVRTAEAKGLTARVIRGRHVLRNAMLPVVTTVGLQVGALLGGAILTETVFSIRGIGDALATAFRDKDYPVLQVLIIAAAAIYVLVNLMVDIAYALIDPRIRTR
ncbi:ABC transporter permease [Nocardioides sp. zg-1308]|jgi:peptide/nickel transport system permease protein|uniref:ABC transporter permease n=1 Tax=Nocardioides renjunii TaxID=3095075 RepID=A0ABU5KAY6_9ACTN|nr:MULTISPECIES: ABC transporter permease [unclassified Nocardioides]MDZ5662051.1 ABC transporter permease [Nocardioides sp. S-58]NPD06241.1 ABC transporter permease [Nocardioides sp. zg-1308]WQQ24290.1 ABC transporter permease [Nocardioides sp. S-34]